MRRKFLTQTLYLYKDLERGIMSDDNTSDVEASEPDGELGNMTPEDDDSGQEQTEDSPDHAAENADLRVVLQAFVGDEVALDEFLNENLTYKRDGTPVFRMPESKEAEKSAAQPKRPRSRPAGRPSKQSIANPTQSSTDQRKALEKRFAEWQVS